MITLKNLEKTYNKGKVKAVNGINLEVKSGEIFGFLGPNGAGKSTTIKMITGLLKPDNGQITIDGIDIRKDPVKAKSLIGYVPDEPMLYDKMSGRRFLIFIADIFELDASVESRIEELAETFGLTDALEDPVSSYSHGMRQKLSIIAALIHDPQVFILDEPIQGLDPKSAFILKETMRKVCDLGKTVFFSTHVMEVAEKICDRVAIIKQGEIIASGDLVTLKKENQNTTLENLFLELTDESVHID